MDTDMNFRTHYIADRLLPGANRPGTDACARLPYRRQFKDGIHQP